MTEFVLNEIETLGPLAVFILLMLSGIGVPLSEDLIIIPAAILAGNGHFDITLTAIAAYLGVVTSDYLWFAICHRYGTPLLHKRWFKRFAHPRRLLEAKHQIERRGIWVIVMARFIPGSRTPAITMAGMLHLPFWKFAIVTAGCAVVSVGVQIGLGLLVAYGVGTENGARVALTVMGMVMLLVALLLGLAWWRQHRRHARPPRAKAAWLRRFRAHRPRLIKRPST